MSAAIVDAGGSAVSGTTSSSQKLVIDTSTSKNQSVDAQTDDANGALALVLSSMTDTADGVHAGTGNDKITKSTTPVFSGHFGAGKTWTSNGDVFQFSVQNLAGDVIDLSPTLGSGSSNWTSANWSTPLANDALYIAKARILDAAGNVLSTRQQAFALDKTAPSLQFTETVKDISIEGSGFSNGMIVSKFSLSSNEAVHYTLKSGNQVLAQGDYTGAAGSTNQTITGSFEAGTFVVSYTDLAGNTSEYTHTSKLVFNNVALTTALPTHGYTAPPAPQQALGTIGTIRMAATQASLDLSAIVADSKIHNHIDMADPAAQQLTLNLNDVLSLGASNSFRVNDLLQIRVDGGNNDRVQFKDRSAWAVASPTVDIGSDHYTLYTSHDAQLHMVEVLIQQGIQVS
ncbi:MAG: hypothetical protein FJY36_02930 [Betaproteobacteria bacterium]|nr:hypothetical protein [Betaproteobacteria bacterium]